MSELVVTCGKGLDLQHKLGKQRGVTNEEFDSALTDSAKLDQLTAVFKGPQSAEWAKAILDAEQWWLQNFFGREFDLSLMKATLERYDQAKVAEWQKLGLEVHFLPKIVLTQDTTLDAWKIRPENWYWQQLAARNLLITDPKQGLVKARDVGLEGIVVLIDTRKKPNYDNGKQMFARDRDYMGRVIERLRKEGKLARYEYGLQTSRFGISSLEWEDHLKAALAKHLGLESTQLRLETAIEANIVPQLYTDMPRKDDGTTSTWVWYDEFFESALRRLIGGCSDDGGLADVDYDGSGTHWGGSAVRPLGVLARA